MSAPWLLQGGIACAGIAVAAAVAWTARRWSRRDPVLGYSFVVALLVAALLAPAAQWWVRGTRHAAAEPWRQWWRATFATGESGAIPAGNDGDGELRSVAPRTPSAADGAADGASPKSPGVLVFRDRRDSSPAGGRLGSGRPRGATGIVEAPAPTAPRFDPGADFDVGGQPADLRRTGVLAAGGSKAVSGWPAFDRATGQRALLTIWFAGVVVLLVRRGRRLAGTLRLIRRAGPVVQADHLELWADLQRETPVAARARLRRSDSVTSPACFGWLRPVLLIPDRGTSALSTDALRWALRHELVHVARGDALVAAAQAVATTLFWFHPAAWWLSAEATRLRELSCDLEVVRRCGRRRNYAHALLEHVAVMDSVSSASDAGPHSAGVRCALLHWGRSPTQIERRIEMLTSGSLVEAPSARRCGGRLLAGSLFLLPLLTQLGAAATLVPGDEPVAPRASASTVPSAVPGISPAPAAPARPDVAAASAAPAGPAETTAPSHVSLLTGTALGHVSQSTGGVAGDDRAKTKRVRVNKVAPAGAVPAAPTDDAVAPQPRTAETVRRLHELATALSDAAHRGDFAAAETLAKKLAQLHGDTALKDTMRVIHEGHAPRPELARVVRVGDRAIGSDSECESVCDNECDVACDDQRPDGTQSFAGLAELAELWPQAERDLAVDFAELADDLRCELSDLDSELADLSCELDDLGELAAMGETDWRGVEADFAEARAEMAEGLAEARRDLDQDLDQANQEVLKELHALAKANGGKGLDADQRGAIERQVKAALDQARVEVARALSRQERDLEHSLSRSRADAARQMAKRELARAESRQVDPGAHQTHAEALKRALEQAAAAEALAVENTRLKARRGGRTGQAAASASQDDREARLMAEIEALSNQLHSLKAELDAMRAERAMPTAVPGGDALPRSEPAPKPRVKRKGVGVR